MKNIEFKARLEQPNAVRAALAELNVPLQRRMRQRDTYFNARQGRLKLRQNDEEEAQLIHYHRADEAQARESDYVIVPVEDPVALCELLSRSLGVLVVVEKMRELYFVGHTRIHLDQVKGAGLFVELETIITEQTRAEAEAECEKLREALGISGGQIESRSYADFLSD